MGETPKRTLHSAGGVLWREGPTGIEIALVHRPKYQDWSLPKGRLQPGEHPLAAACREVHEETGIPPIPGQRLSTIRYEVRRRTGMALKTVDYWAMRAAGDGAFTPTDETDDLRWVPLSEVPAVASYAQDVEVVRGFAAMPPVTSTILLLRHAFAGDRKSWQGPDAARPLTSEGEAHMVAMTPLLGLYAPTRIISAWPLRCVQTVEPLALARQLPIEICSVFDEQAHHLAEGRAAERLRELATSHSRVLVCSQGTVITDTVAQLAARDGVSLPDTETAKGACWVLSFHGSTLVSADYLTAAPG